LTASGFTIPLSQPFSTASDAERMCITVLHVPQSQPVVGELRSLVAEHKGRVQRVVDVEAA
jgi:hypothetical protein